MNLTADRRLHALLEPAAHRMKLGARAAVQRAIESLGLAALSSASAHQRDTVLGAQFELNRKSAMFALAFNESLDDRLARELRPQATVPGGQTRTRWDALSLVDDLEVERKISAERFAMENAHTCEWELRELDAYMGSLLGAPQERNPLRPEVIGLALVRGVETVSDAKEIRALLLSEVGRVLATELQSAYRAIVADLHKAGVQPAGLSVKPTAEHGRHVSGYDSLRDAPESSRVGSLSDAGSSYGGPAGGAATTGRSRYGASSTTSSRLDGTLLGHVDVQLMSLIRRIVQMDPAAMSSAATDWGDPASAGAMLPPNLIRAHRDELRRVSTGSLDHMVIDVIGSLFDQILSDPKVPPQMARQIGRLQLPVLRAAMGDPSFFSSRRHPVRRFINRIASLAAAYDDFGDEDAKRFMAHVRDLVQGIVEGDFEQIDLYEGKLDELEHFIAELAQEEVKAQGDPAAVLGEKETELRLTQAYAKKLHAELQGLEGPDFVRDFLTEIWSQVLVHAARRHGDDSEPFLRLRDLARELFMSVQPKAMPAQRKEFLARLPKLMQGLSEGMDLIAWPEAARKAFFGLLLPAHAESLKGQGLRTLDFNMLAKRVEGAFQAPLPRKDSLPPPDLHLPVLTDAIPDPRFSAEEAARVGLLDESRIDWAVPVAAGPDSGPVLTEVDIDISGLPPPEPVEPTGGRELADHVQLGFPYQMHLDGDWHKVKLAHVSPGRSFFVFSRGKRHRQTISLTLRMLVRLCETGRLRAYENAYLLERATARARRQLSSLAAPH